jgi:hypothetical protein
MRSHLTRTVFRRLLSNEAFLFRCPHRSSLAIYQRNGTPTVLRPAARRSIFGLSSKKPEQVLREAELDPGLEQMAELNNTGKMKARPPPAKELVNAFNSFFAHKVKKNDKVNKLQARHVLRTFRHLRETNTLEDGFGLTLADLERARDVMKKGPYEDDKIFADFARDVFAELKERRAAKEDMKSLIQDVKSLLLVLTRTGNTAEAVAYAKEYSTSEGTKKYLEDSVEKYWKHIMVGFSLEDNEAGLLEALERYESYGMKFDSKVHEVITTFYAKRNDASKTKEWYNKPISDDARSKKVNPETLLEILRFSLRNDEMEWCNSTFRSIVQANPSKGTWDIIFLWAAAGLDKGVEEVEKMMEVMARYNPDHYDKRPDSNTFNLLVELAISKKNFYLAERYLALARKLGIRPNARTCIMQMDYRIDADDLSGAQGAYRALQAEEISQWEDVPVVNKYIRALCSVKSPNYERIVDIVNDLKERQARLDPDTVSAVTLLHFKRGDIVEAINTLQSHVYHHTEEGRSHTRDAIYDFCMDRDNRTSLVWDSYVVMRQVFPETDREMRTKLMAEFFNRKRSDMACHVFGHMRQHNDPEKRPVNETYVQCLEGIAECKDEDNLDMVHNMMKMDSSIEPSTKLYNALMIAYTACDDPERALDFWVDITNSREGPTYSSIEIVLQACEAQPYGDKPARDIWNKMKRMEIEITPEVYNAYIGALAGSSLIDEAKALIEEMQTDVGYGPNVLT